MRGPSGLRKFSSVQFIHIGVQAGEHARDDGTAWKDKPRPKEPIPWVDKLIARVCVLVTSQINDLKKNTHSN